MPGMGAEQLKVGSRQGNALTVDAISITHILCLAGVRYAPCEFCECTGCGWTVFIRAAKATWKGLQDTVEQALVC